MRLSILSRACLFLFTVYCNFASPCIHWFFDDTGKMNSNLHDKFVMQYHYLFPEHQNLHSSKNCTSEWRIEGYIYRNNLKAPVLNSIFGVFGSTKRFKTEIIHLNLSVADIQIPDREAEHILIEYSVSDGSFKLNEVLNDLAKSFNKQLVSIVKGRLAEAPIYLNPKTYWPNSDSIDHWPKIIYSDTLR